MLALEKFIFHATAPISRFGLFYYEIHSLIPLDLHGCSYVRLDFFLFDSDILNMSKNVE